MTLPASSSSGMKIHALRPARAACAATAFARLPVDAQPMVSSPKAAAALIAAATTRSLKESGGRDGGARGPTAPAAERPGGERRGSDGSRHVSLNKKTRATTAAGGRFLAPCLTWRQYAANHHESSIVDLNNTRRSNRPQPEPPPPRSAGSRRAPAPAPPARWPSTVVGAPRRPARTPFQPAPRYAGPRAAARQRS